MLSNVPIVAIKLASTFSAKRVTLSVSPIASTSQAESAIANRRTMKGMQCALAGIPMVSCEWIQLCLSESNVVLPKSSMYIRTLPSETGKFDHGVALLAAFQQRANVPPFPLQHCHVFLSGIRLEKQNDTNAILREAGGQFVSNASALLKLWNEQLELASVESPQKLVIVCDDVLPRTVASYFQQSHPSIKYPMVVNSSWVFDSVSAGQILPSMDYPPTHISARQLWEQAQHQS